MSDKTVPASSALRTKVSTGYGRLDEALQGGFLTGSAIVLSAPASDEVPLLLRNFLMSDKGEGLLLSRSLSSAQVVTQSESDDLKCLICSEKPVPPSKNAMPGKGIENLTELNFQITEVIGSIQPKRVAIDILSDILLRHKALQTRKWLTELLERLRSKGITILTVLNPYMHSNEDVQAVVDLFDGNLEIIEKDVEGTLRKFFRVKWMHGVEVAEKEFLLIDLAPYPQTPSRQATVTAAPLKEPRWLTPLISRTAELSKLKTTFANALANRSSVVALQGEVGVGKTRLIQELAVYAQAKNAVVLSGSASEDSLPYAPWIEIARQFVAQASGELLRRMLGTNASELVKLVPDIAAKLGTIPPSKALGEQQDKLRFYEAVTQFCIAICKDTPLVLLFDDMQYADQSSLDLLEYFVRSSSNLRVLTVCSVPAEQELESNNPLEQTLMNFNKQRLLETVTVKNLDKEDTANLIKQVFGEQTVSPEFADLIYQRTGGNPFFIEEVLRSLVEDGTIFRTEKGWDRKPIQEIEIPKSVKNTLKSRLAKLDSETLNVLTIASVTGSEFEFGVLQEISELSEDTLLGEIEKALRAGLLVEIPRQLKRFKFADDRIRELLLHDLSGMRRAKYHLKIAEAMEKQYANNLQSRAETLANHFAEGGDAKRGAKYLIMAGDRARAIHAYEQAAKDYRQALDLTDLEGGKDEEKAVMLEKLAESHRVAGHLQEAEHCFKDALAIFERLHDRKACSRVCLGISKIAVSTNRYEEAILVLKQGGEYLETEPECLEVASIYARLAWTHAVIDEWDEANAWAEKALRVGEKTQNYAAIADSLGTKASFLADTGRIDEGLPFWERAYEMALKNEQYDAAIYALANLGNYTFPRNLLKARELAVRRLELCKRLNHITAEAAAWEALWIYDWYAGDWKAVLEELMKGSQIMERLGLFEVQAWAFDHGWFLLGKGDLEQAEAEFQKPEVTDVMKKSPKLTLRVLYHLELGILREAQGRELEAKEHYETAVNAFKKWEFTTYPHLHIETLLRLTGIYVKHGKLDEARKMSEWAKRLAETLKSDAGLAMASQAEAYVRLAEGDRPGALEAYEECLILWEKAGWPYYHAKALVAYSEAVAQTNADESKKRLEQAAEIFRKLGAKRDLEKAETKLQVRQG